MLGLFIKSLRPQDKAHSLNHLFKIAQKLHEHVEKQTMAYHVWLNATTVLKFRADVTKTTTRGRLILISCDNLQWLYNNNAQYYPVRGIPPSSPIPKIAPVNWLNYRLIICE
jgi:hypothetical protein